MNQDTNIIIREYLLTQATVTGLVGTRIMSPRLYENCELPAISFFTRGGPGTNPHIPPEVHCSVQFDCWANDPIDAREVYLALYDVLQGLQFTDVNVAGTDYRIASAIEEVPGQDLQDVDIPEYYRVLTYFSFIIQAEP